MLSFFCSVMNPITLSLYNKSCNYIIPRLKMQYRLIITFLFEDQFLDILDKFIITCVLNDMNSTYDALNTKELPIRYQFD